MTFPEVPRRWPGGTVVCMASGPSLTVEDIAYVRDKAPVIAVNTTYQKVLWADVLYACDAKWWGWHGQQVTESFHGLKYALEKPARHWPGVTVLRKTGVLGLERHPSGVKDGRNSGYQAVNVAYHLVGRGGRILLLGYDLKVGPHGEEHHHADHPNRSRARYEPYVRAFRSIAGPLQEAGVSVINCSRRTALTMFPRLTIQEALEGSLEATT